jgi:hypothetical protein
MSPHPFKGTGSWCSGKDFSSMLIPSDQHFSAQLLAALKNHQLKT